MDVSPQLRESPNTNGAVDNARVPNREECFGMIFLPHFKLSPNWTACEPPIPLTYDDDLGCLHDPEAKCLFGALGQISRKIIRVLRKDIIIQIFADSIGHPSAQTNSRDGDNHHKGKNLLGRSSLEICVNLYGQPNLFEAVGNFAAQCHLYLQQPRHCTLNVHYRNPHCLTPENDEKIYTFDLRHSKQEIELVSDNLANPIDLFADTVIQDTLAFAETPHALATNLYNHQKQALTFMTQREQGWAMEEQHKDIWKRERTPQGHTVYRNVISGAKQSREPNPFRGGLLIDAPGLGKSLSIIALVTNNVGRRLGPTLLVVPKSLIQMWRDELDKHLKPQHTLKYCVYYGKDRDHYLKEVQTFDLVITTYALVRLDWKQRPSTGEGNATLHTIRWDRVVLDEAHIIREPTKSFAKSVFALEADKRWAVTGTPIQNRLTDLYSLFKFLRCYPFDELGYFNAQVIEKWKAQSDSGSVAKLKLLVNCLSLRRPKTTISLPERTNELKRLDFTERELQQYRQTRDSVSKSIKSVEDGRQALGSPIYSNILQWLNELRLMCNHGMKEFIDMSTMDICAQPWSPTEAQACFDALENVGLAKCSNITCSQDLSSSLLTSEGTFEHDDDPWISEALELWCKSCFSKQTEKYNQWYPVCNHIPKRALKAPPKTYQVSKDMAGSSDTSKPKDCLPTNGLRMSSKYRKLVQDLSETTGDIKSVVFSCWTRTFDIVGPELRANAINFVRLDGTLSAPRRSSVLHMFRTNPEIKVLLATISCGGIGLDLTAASRVYIMEPQWNPMSESQAIDRVYRLGQKKEVVTIRYIMKNTWEEEILKLQEKKQELADLAVNHRDISKVDLSQKRLKYLKDLLG